MAAELAAVDEHFDSTIEVGMSLSDGVELLPRLVKKFHDVHPEAMVHLDAGYEPELIAKLKSGKLDLQFWKTILLRTKYPAKPWATKSSASLLLWGLPMTVRPSRFL